MNPIKSSALGVCLLVSAALLTGCNGEAAAKKDLGALNQALKPTGSAWSKLLNGETREAREALEATAVPKDRVQAAWRAYGLGESAAYLGDYEASVAAHVEAITLAPDKPPAAWSMLRLLDLEGLAAGFHEAVRPALEAIRAPSKEGVGAPSALTRYLSQVLALQMASYTWRHSDSDQPFDGGPMGVPTQWRVVGPTSIHANLDIDKTTAMEEDPALADTYNLLGFERRTKTLFTTDTRVTNPNGLGGIYVAETWLELESSSTFDLAVDFLGLAVLSIDGKKIARRDDRSEVAPTRARIQGLKLSAGVHRIVVRLAHEPRYKDEFGLMFLPANPKIETRFSATHPDAKRGRVLKSGNQVPWIGPYFAASKLGGAPMLQTMALQLGTFTRNEAPSREALKMLETTAPRFAGGKLAIAEFYSNLATLPSDIRRVKVQTTLKEALALDEDLSRVRRWLAILLRRQGLKEATGEQLDALLAAPGDHAADWLEAARYYQWRGFSAKAEAAWKRALELDPNDCYTASSLYRAYRQRDFTPSAKDPNAGVFERCNSTSLDLIKDVKVRQGDKDALLLHRQRDIKRRPDDINTWLRLVSALRDHRGEDEAMATIDEALVWHPDNLDLISIKASIHEARGDIEAARKLLTRGLEAHPGSWSMHQQLALIGGDLPLADLLADGKSAIKAFNPKGAALNSAAVYVLDYMARRYFEDGSSADVTHLVIKVLGKEGLNKYGEVSFPQGAIPLMIRTIKADGEVIEAQPQQGKSTVSMPSLDVGDNIEYAYLTFNSRYIARMGATIGPSFYFQMAKIASAHSELVIEVPKDWEMTFVPRHGPPKTEESVSGDRTRYRWLRQGSAQPRPEPHAVPNAEFLPHVEMVHRYGWEDSLRSYQNRLAGAQALSPLLVERANEVTKNANNKRAEAEAIFRFVTAHVRQPAYRNFSTSAIHVEQSGEGNPVVLLQALLKARGIESRIHMIRGRASDPEDTAIPSLGKYGFTALAVKIGGETLWLNPAGRHAPFNLIPRPFQGEPAICIEPGAAFERITTPSFDPDYDRRDVRFEMTLDSEGGLKGTITETLRGVRATGRRTTYDEMSTPDKMRKFVERFLNGDISGGVLVDFEIKGRDNPEAELVLVIRFERPDYARKAADGTLVIEDRYDLLDMTRRFGRLSERTIPLMLNGRRDELVVVSLTAPTGSSIEGPGGKDSVEYQSDFGSYDRSVERSGNVLKMAHRLVVPLQRVSPDAYPAFRSWSGDIDRATYVRIAIGQ